MGSHHRLHQCPLQSILSGSCEGATTAQKVHLHIRTGETVSVSVACTCELWPTFTNEGVSYSVLLVLLSMLIMSTPLGGGYIIFAFFAVRCPMSGVRRPASDVRRHAWFPLI